MAYIYKITNQLNGKSYIGKTLKSSIEGRWKEHLRDRLRVYEEKRPLYDAINKYGPEHFLIEEIEECSPEEANEKEIYWINYYDTYHNGYNATLGGEGKHYLDYDLIISTYKETQNVNKTAEKLNCSRDSVKKVLKSNNIEIKPSQEIAKEKQGKKCKMISPITKETIKVFDSISDASRYLIENKITTNTNFSDVLKCISKACNGKSKTSYKYIWQFIE